MNDSYLNQQLTALNVNEIVQISTDYAPISLASCLSSFC